ncbi:GRAM domain-containing protein 2A isoform X1 [Calypte anna]|uniref:GRAM domain-containing protein 2A isoform X1 n=1 Tax=Calypte anna TaxID=9244 RepID=UPI0011C3954E|nr:GRAM domain-containing protein 2A isoform X1 [Calypte anna]XP_030312932.1 GRAM domain-containing protein 2A isoform X1 [Calypte anna]XP_030312933.1 GRAM domain-containing protein 2A isoform X1 [Calypte anna]
MHEKVSPLKSPEPMHGREKLEASHKEKSLDSLDGSLHLNEALKDEDIKKCHREVAASKYNSQYHKLFKDIPTEESVLKVCSCALQRDILIQGRLYISPNWLCFYANLFGKDIKVVIPVVSVQLIKKHKTARLLPNGLAITTTASRKILSLSLLQYIFVSLISRDSVYDVLRRVCTHLQVSSKKSLSLKELSEEPDAVSLVRVRAALGEGRTPTNSPCGQESSHLAPSEVIVPEGKWRKVSPASLSLSLPDTDYQCIHRTSVSSLSAKESSCTSEEPLVSESAINTEEELEVEQSCVAELRPSDYQLLKIFIVLICLLVVSSSYLAFRIFRLEQQLCSLNRDYLSRGHRR